LESLCPVRRLRATVTLRWGRKEVLYPALLPLVELGQG
jgi:hypothetical protein